LIACGVGEGDDAHAIIIDGWYIDGEPYVRFQDPSGQQGLSYKYAELSQGKAPGYDWKRTYLTR
jgi:hypothetical protein